MKKTTILLLIFFAWCFNSHSANWEGSGTESDPFLISTPQQFADLAKEVNNGTDFFNEVFSLTNDIDLSNICNDSIGSWTPIGTKYNYFEGTFQGNGFAVKNLYIDIRNNNNYCGLFGHIGEHGSILNLTLKNGFVYITFWSGGIAGANNGIISNCKNENCTVESWRYSGGICGVNFNTIENCTNIANVSSNLCTGGICSYNYGTIINCSNQNSVTAYEGCGGICGYNGGFANTTANCYDVKVGFIDKCSNSSSILGEDKIGGIAGRNDGFIANSMNCGEINGDQQVGGITGLNGGFDGVTGNISNSFNIGRVIGKDMLAGGIVGYGNEASEIYNVYTTANIHCINTPEIEILGKEIGQKDNCFIPVENDNEYLQSIVNKMNNWIETQSDQSSYLKWETKDKKLYQINELEQPYHFIEDNLNTINHNKETIKIFCQKGILYIFSPIKEIINIYSIDGKIVRTLDLQENIMIQVNIEKGLYIVNGKKVVVY